MRYRTKTCKCGTKFKQYNSLQTKCVPCLIDEGKKQKEEKKKTWPERKKKMQEGLKTRTQKINETRKVFQQYIRERDKDKPCISCGTIKSQYWDAGHYLKAELYTGLIFNEDNVHKQCRKCNSFLGGNEIEYRIGLVERIGEDRVKQLEESRHTLRVYKWSDEELDWIKTKSKSFLKKK